MLCKQLEGVDVSVLTKESSAFKGAVSTHIITYYMCVVVYMQVISYLTIFYISHHTNKRNAK